MPECEVLCCERCTRSEEKRSKESEERGHGDEASKLARTVD